MARTEYNWSKYQVNIFNNIESGIGHLIVEALAGCSKTTTIIESFYHIPSNKKVIALAFNKIIQNELKQKSPSHVEAVTFHSLGYRSIRQRFGNVTVDDMKVMNLIKDMLGKDTDYELMKELSDTVSYCKYGLVDTISGIKDIIDQFNIDVGELHIDNFVSLVIKILDVDKKVTNVIDYNDMCWFPYVHNLFLGKYDFIFVDEAQDLNKSQLMMAKMLCHETSRIVAVLDQNQQLYSWRMSDNTIIEDIKKMTSTTVLSLPVSYRCPKRVVDLVKPWVPEFTCPDFALEGNISNISTNELYDKAMPGCFVLSRFNAPLIGVCLKFIKEGKKSNIRGRDVGKQLLSLVKKSKKKQIKTFLIWLENWKIRELKKLESKKLNTDSVLDRYECLLVLCDDSKTITELADKINNLFNDTDEANIIICSTVHRAKGLERDNVFLLKWTFRTWFDKTLVHPDEEMNIAYVACTRAKKNLYLVKKSSF